jgi:hypothetical protein
MISVSNDGARRIAHARAKYDEWYGRLVAAIREEASVTPTEAAGKAKWSREYIGQIRAGTAGNVPPKSRRRAPRAETTPDGSPAS